MTPEAKPSPEDLRRMRMFNDKANDLRRSSFFRVMATTRTGIDMSWKKGQPEPVASVRGPDEEAIKAMILDLRFLIQKDPQSLRSMADLYQRLPSTSAHRTKWIQVRDDINRWLDKEAQPRIVYNGKTLTNRRLIDLVVYGQRSHTERTKHAVVEGMQVWSAGSAFLKNGFNTVAMLFIDEVFHLQIENATLYEELTGVKLVIEWPKPTENVTA